MQYFEKQGNALIFRQDGETVRVEPWQKDSLRVRGTLLSEIEEGSIALLDPERYFLINDSTLSQTFAMN